MDERMEGAGKEGEGRGRKRGRLEKSPNARGPFPSTDATGSAKDLSASSLSTGLD